MSASDHIHPALKDKVRFLLNPQDRSKDYSPQATVEVRHSDTNELLGHMDWDSKHVIDIEIQDPPFQAQGLPKSGSLTRHGLGTAMWLRAHQAHVDEPHLYPLPKHSDWRTPQGDSWAYHLWLNRIGEEPPLNRMDDI